MSIKLANFFRFLTNKPKITNHSVSYTLQTNGKAVRTVTYYYEAQ
ncbi:hypothetical protein [Nostoc sp. UIC 10630]|nr:hypothetical protein [Nostoc sp. UIC 10630]